jgi:hypothetical protein
MRYLRYLTASIFLWISVLQPANGQRAVFVGENDAVAGTDRDYTGGFRGSIVYDDFTRDVRAAQIYNALTPAMIVAGSPDGPTRQQLEWIYLGQSVFTPDKIANPIRSPGDRPFAGWLYAGLAAARETGGHQLDSFEVLAGVIGPASFDGQTQSTFHRLLNQPVPVISGYQIHNEPGLLLAWDRRWKFETDLGNQFGIDVIPSLGVTAGNVLTYGSSGAVVRFGRGLATTWGPTLVRPAPSGASFLSRDNNAPYLGFDVFAGVEGRAVARNAFLDGNLFQESPRVTRNVAVLDLLAGAEMFTQSGFRFGFTVVRRSREYSTQSSPSTFGSIDATFRF